MKQISIFAVPNIVKWVLKSLAAGAFFAASLNAAESEYSGGSGGGERSLLMSNAGMQTAFTNCSGTVEIDGFLFTLQSYGETCTWGSSAGGSTASGSLAVIDDTVYYSMTMDGITATIEMWPDDVYGGVIVQTTIYNGDGTSVTTIKVVEGTNQWW